MSANGKGEDRYEELLQLTRDQMQTMEKAVEDLKNIQKKLEKLRSLASASSRL